jgi:hypothetical protein
MRCRFCRAGPLSRCCRTLAISAMTVPVAASWPATASCPAEHPRAAQPPPWPTRRRLRGPTSAIRPNFPVRSGDRARARSSWEVRIERIVFAVAAAAAVAHLVDHLLVGVEMDLQFEGVLAFGAVTVVAALAYPRVPRRLQAVGSIALGLGWLVGDFVLHALPTIRDGPQATDYTGLGASVARGLLIGVGIAAALRGRAATRPLTHARGQAT